MPNTLTVEAPIARPVTFRLPKPGESDRFFGFSRAFYYALEKRGELKLIRVLDAGKKKGVTLDAITGLMDIYAWSQVRMAFANGNTRTTLS